MPPIYATVTQNLMAGQQIALHPEKCARFFDEEEPIKDIVAGIHMFGISNHPEDEQKAMFDEIILRTRERYPSSLKAIMYVLFLLARPQLGVNAGILPELATKMLEAASLSDDVLAN